MYLAHSKKMMTTFCKDIDIIIMIMIQVVINSMMIAITLVECLNFVKIILL